MSDFIFRVFKILEKINVSNLEFWVYNVNAGGLLPLNEFKT